MSNRILSGCKTAIHFIRHERASTELQTLRGMLAIVLRPVLDSTKPKYFAIWDAINHARLANRVDEEHLMDNIVIMLSVIVNDEQHV
jgi:hypothetical protein